MTNITSVKAASIRALGILVLVPTTLAAVFFSLLALGKWVSFLRSGAVSINDTLMHCAMVAVVVLGGLGILAGWKLYYHFLHFSLPPAWSKLALAGLLCGTIASLVLMSTLAGSLWFRVVVMGWPLIAVISFVWLLLRRRA
ncbi:hypothetical protein [Pseudomonas sp. ICMP 561]|uniref:hypothetical protein n=1 Tax=Pseudomonas sp. ICMP 561 TaxID=1718918 RepID=UPI000C08AC3F|nr:hypothetical protein [Pseudomonas sp. ICMP 561]PHN27596.1 hypothetical protein AO242_28215 [Pseudomonas sp. ICMP 561]